MLIKLVAVYILFNIFDSNEAARILAVIPTPSISHQVVFRPLTQELVKRGHEVVVVTPDPAFPKGATPTNLTEIDVHDVTYAVLKNMKHKILFGRPEYIADQFKIFLDYGSLIFEALTQHPHVQDLINNKRDYFDLLIIEASIRPALGLTHIFKAPVIQASSLGAVAGNYDIIGAPSHPLLYPLIHHVRIYNLTFWEKVKEAFNDYIVRSAYESHIKTENELLKRLFGPDIPNISELSNNVDMLFLNIHPIWEGNHPVPPSVVYMWGIHKKPEKELLKDLKAFLDASVNGVIYMSFGSNAVPSQLPPEKIQMFINVFSQLPYDILWKWDEDELAGISKNVKIGKWFPQSDLLKHPKIKLFITQGGLQSADETIAAGVPVICIPMLADQWYNAEKFSHHKIGVHLELEDLSEENLRKAIDTVLGDKRYRANTVKLRELMQDQPQPPLERVVWWTEHVLRHGGARHLRAPAANMPWRDFLELDLVFTLVTGFLFLMAVCVYVLYRCYVCFFVNKKLKIS